MHTHTKRKGCIKDISAKYISHDNYSFGAHGNTLSDPLYHMGFL